MSVSSDDVRHIAGLARIGVPEERLEALAQELNGILAHMETLRAVRTDGVEGANASDSRTMPLREDEPSALPLAVARESLAPRLNGSDDPTPAMKGGFFLVPRLETHEDAGGAS